MFREELYPDASMKVMRHQLAKEIEDMANAIVASMQSQIAQLDFRNTKLMQALLHRWSNFTGAAQTSRRASDLLSLAVIYAMAIEHGQPLSVIQYGYPDEKPKPKKGITVGITALSPLDIVIYQDEVDLLPFTIEHSPTTTLAQLQDWDIAYSEGDNVSIGDKLFALLQIFSTTPTWERCTVIGTTENSRLIKSIHKKYSSLWEGAEHELRESGAFDAEPH